MCVCVCVEEEQVQWERSWFDAVQKEGSHVFKADTTENDFIRECKKMTSFLLHSVKSIARERVIFAGFVKTRPNKLWNEYEGPWDELFYPLFYLINVTCGIGGFQKLLKPWQKCEREKLANIEGFGMNAFINGFLSKQNAVPPLVFWFLIQTQIQNNYWQNASEMFFWFDNTHTHTHSNEHHH